MFSFENKMAKLHHYRHEILEVNTAVFASTISKLTISFMFKQIWKQKKTE